MFNFDDDLFEKNFPFIITFFGRFRCFEKMKVWKQTLKTFKVYSLFIYLLLLKFFPSGYNTD